MENLKETMKDVLENNILNYWIPFIESTYFL